MEPDGISLYESREREREREREIPFLVWYKKKIIRKSSIITDVLLT